MEVTLKKYLSSDSFLHFYHGVGFGNRLIEKLVSYLFILNFLFMTRFYAISNLVETIIFFIFLCDTKLRRQFYAVAKDISVFFLLLFFGWALLSGLWSSASWEIILIDWWSWRKILLFPIGLIIFSNKKFALLGLKLFFLVGLLFLMLSYLMLIFDIEILWGRKYSEILQNHNAQGVYFSILGLISMILAKEIIKQKTGGWILVGVGLAFFVVVGWFGTSRTGYVSFIICSALSAMYWFGVNLRTLVLGIALSGSVLYLSPLANQRATQAMTELAIGGDAEIWQGNSGGIRVVMWENTIDIIRHNLFFGVGAGDFKKAYAEQVEGTVGWTGIVTDDPHNQYLHLLAEYGLVGFLLFGLYVVSVGWRSFRYSPFCVCILGLLLVSLAISLFNSSFGSSIEGRVIQMGIALLISLDQITDRRNSRI